MEIRRVQVETEVLLKEHAAAVAQHGSNSESADSSHDDTAIPLPPLPPVPQALVLLPEFDEGSRNNRGLENDMTGGLLGPGEIDWNDNTYVILLSLVDVIHRKQQYPRCCAAYGS